MLWKQTGPPLLRSAKVISGNLFPLKVLKHTVNLLLTKGLGCTISDVMNTSFPKNKINKNKTNKQTKIKKIYNNSNNNNQNQKIYIHKKDSIR